MWNIGMRLKSISRCETEASTSIQERQEDCTGGWSSVFFERHCWSLNLSFCQPLFRHNVASHPSYVSRETTQSEEMKALTVLLVAVLVCKSQLHGRSRSSLHKHRKPLGNVPTQLGFVTVTEQHSILTQHDTVPVRLTQTRTCTQPKGHYGCVSATARAQSTLQQPG